MQNEKREPIYVYVTKEEKELLQDKAKDKDMKLSAYVKSVLFQENKRPSSFLDSFQSNEILDSKAERNCVVVTYLNEEEAQYVKKIAGNLPVSAFIRKTLLSANNGKFTFEVKTDDLDDIRKALAEFNMRMEGIIGALSYRTNLYQSDVTHMRQMVDELNKDVKKSMSMAMVDRNYVRKKGIKHLQEQIDRLLSVTEEQGGKMNDSDM